MTDLVESNGGEATDSDTGPGDTRQSDNGAQPASEGGNAPALRPELIQDIPVSLDALVGSAEITVSDMLALQSGSVVTLDATLNHLVSLMLKDRLIARGELVAVGDKFGVRLTEIG
ncbi:MAG: FliM/FliN family flagellar motor switch protein [Pseudomonadota bacterium]